MPGMGKTELAIAVAIAARQDGLLELERIVWISLDGMTEVRMLRERLARVFGVKSDECRSDNDLAEHIGNVRALVVIDNAEDLLHGLVRLQVQDLLEVLLEKCCGICLLITSRRRVGDLRRAKEKEVELLRLEPPDDRGLFISAVGERLSFQEARSPELAKLLNELVDCPTSHST